MPATIVLRPITRPVLAVQPVIVRTRAEGARR
jgi:hypothetical protein